MRQAGILAAAAIYALDNSLPNIAHDHAKARHLAEELARIQSLRIDMSEVQTNMVFIDIAPTGKSQSEVLESLAGRGVLLTPERSTFIRAVTHLDVSDADVEEAIRAFRAIFR